MRLSPRAYWTIIAVCLYVFVHAAVLAIMALLRQERRR
jgi:hypothetical protein